MLPGPLTILTIDDEPDIRGIISKIFRRNGCRVIEAGNGEEGIRLATETPLDLIFVDVGMPEMDGNQVVRELRNNPQTREIPVVIVSGFESESDRRCGLEAGADDYLTKPFYPTELLERVRTILGKERSAHRLRRLALAQNES